MTDSVNRIHAFEVVQQTGASTGNQSVNRVHAFAVIRKQPVFSIGGSDEDELHVSGPMAGDWPVTVRSTDANGDHFDKTFTVTISDA